MSTKYTLRIVIIMLLTLTLSACSDGGGHVANSQSVPTKTDPLSPVGISPWNGEGGRTYVKSIDIVMRESFPVQISVNIKGDVSDPCTTAGPITQERDGNTFHITVGATHPKDVACPQVIAPFEQSIALDSVGLRAGTYSVDVNGITATFHLPADNIFP